MTDGKSGASRATTNGPPARARPADDRLATAERILRASSGPRVRSRFPLAALTSFRLGGPAALYLEAEADDDLAGAAEAVRAAGLPWTVIGKGSNLLVSDEGFRGLVVRLGKGYRWAARDGERLRAGGSMPLPALAGVALVHGLTGLEFGVAIPATLGGAVRMNAGAHARAVADAAESIDLYSMRDPGRSRVPAEAAGFSYRRSRLPEGSIVVGATVALAVGDRAAIRAAMDEARAWRRATSRWRSPTAAASSRTRPAITRHAWWRPRGQRAWASARPGSPRSTRTSSSPAPARPPRMSGG